ncbi:MAG: hypothetical protein FWF59_01105 [Turicibacter sp.]|nr:hypothetical protein [Turicibacter sp.]
MKIFGIVLSGFMLAIILFPSLQTVIAAEAYPSDYTEDTLLVEAKYDELFLGKQAYSFQDVYYSTGIVMSPTEFERAFGGRAEKRIMPRMLQTAELTLNEIELNDNTVQLELLLTRGYNEIILPLEGNIYKGNRDEQSFLIDIPELANGFEVLLFEVNLSPESSNLLLPTSHSESLKANPHVKLYILDENNSIYLFEFQAPQAFFELYSQQFQEIEDLRDFLWVMDFLEPVLEEIESTEENLQKLGLLEGVNNEFLDETGVASRGLNVWTVIDFALTSFTGTVNIGVEELRHSSIPIFRRTHQNIGRSAEVTFILEFRVVESISIRRNGVLTHTQTGNGHQEWRYRNVTLQMGVGNQSEIVSHQLSGRFTRRSLTNLFTAATRSAGSSVATRLATNIGGANAGTALSLIQNVIRANSNSNVRLGGDFVANTDSPRAASRALSPDYLLYQHFANSNSGHIFRMDARVRRHGVGNRVNNTAAKRITFDVYWAGRRQGANRVWSTTFSHVVEANN